MIIITAYRQSSQLFLSELQILKIAQKPNRQLCSQSTPFSAPQYYLKTIQFLWSECRLSIQIKQKVSFWVFWVVKTKFSKTCCRCSRPNLTGILNTRGNPACLEILRHSAAVIGRINLSSSCHNFSFIIISKPWVL